MKFLSFVLIICALTVLAKGEDQIDKSDVLEVSVDTFDNFIELTKTTDYLVFFYSPNCPYCQSINEDLKNLKTMVADYNQKVATPQNKPQLKIAFINGIENKPLIPKLGVEFYPTFIFYMNGLVRFYPQSGDRKAQNLFDFYTKDYLKVLPEIPGVRRNILTKQAIYTFYNKLANKYEQLPELFWAAGAILGLGLLLHSFLYRKL